MNYLNAAPNKLFAAVASATITVVVTASIMVGMAGRPILVNAQVMAATPADVSVQG